MEKDELNDLIYNGEFETVGCQYTIMYMGRLFSQGEFIGYKILSLIGKLYSQYEASQVVEAFAIKTLCDWEFYIERIIYECLKNDTTNLSKQLDLDLPKAISIDECTAYLNGLGYFDLKSCSNLRAIARKILVKENNPFDNLNKEAIKHIDDYYSLRNYIAHKSNKSKKSLLLVYEKYQQTSFIEAGDFLLSKSTDSNVLKIQKFESSFWLATYNILEFLYPKTYDWIMKDEEIYNDACQKRFLKLIELGPNKPK